MRKNNISSKKILFIDFIGALLKHRVFLYLYGIILSILMLGELAIFITVMSSRVRIRDSYESGLLRVFTDAYTNHRQDLIEAVEELEREFKCCGVINAKDYAKVNYTLLPKSCYTDQSFLEPVFEQGCAEAFIDWMWDELPIVGGVIGGILFIEIFGVISSFSLAVAVSHYSYGKIDGLLLTESNV